MQADAEVSKSFTPPSPWTLRKPAAVPAPGEAITSRGLAIDSPIQLDNPDLHDRQDEADMVMVGLNVNYQAYDKSQNYFTFGNGGYFNPQNFIPRGFPVNYTLQDERWDAAASFTPGFQSYKEDQSPNAETR